MDAKLIKINIKGFKSIDANRGQDIALSNLNVLIGPNGVGKSNLCSFFKMLNYITSNSLQNYVGRYGMSQILHYGPKKTESFEFTLYSQYKDSLDSYTARLSYGLPDRIFFNSEKIEINLHDNRHEEFYLDSAGSHETKLKENNHTSSNIIYTLLQGIRTYQFHDTSETAKIRERGYVDDARYLRDNAGNLAAFLRMLKENEEYNAYYQRIVSRIRRIFPNFGDFILETLPGNKEYLHLNWTDSSGYDYIFGPDQISDGSLRFMALTTLLLQPPELLPRFIVIDEPELGLHPAAISELGSMLRSVSKKVQILIATQSTILVDEFQLDDIIIAEWDEMNHCSIFRKEKEDQLQDWLKEYSLSELWEKNVLSRQP